MYARLVAASLLLLATVSTSMAAGHPILGRRIIVKDPTGDPERRTVIILAKERPTDVGTLSDPTISGAQLEVALSGGTSSNASYYLPAGGWESTGYGYRYTDSVRRVFLKKSASGLVQVKAVLDGAVGFPLAPPNPGTEAQVVLEVYGGDRYCTGFGGVAGGDVVKDTVQQWKILSATTEVACPAPSLPSCPSEYTPCGSCGDGVCVLHYSGEPFRVCASQSGFGAGTCTSNGECTAPRLCYAGGDPCPTQPIGQCVLNCSSDAYCDAAFSPSFCSGSTCAGFCLVPCY